MFIGESLTNIRILNDMSRSQLADKIGITEQAIWQYENGYVSPKLEVINKLKQIFNVKASYFYKHDLLKGYYKENIQVEHIAYRSETMNSLSKTQSESMYIRYLDAFMKNVEKPIEYPENLLLDLRDEIIQFISQNSNLDRSLQIKQAAIIARNKIGLNENTNDNLLFFIEKSGAFIFEKEIGDTIDAYSLWSKDDRPYIILGTLKKAAVRRNFDIAHELGHLLLHYKVEFTMQEKSMYKIFEDEANSFASEFLLPEIQFVQDFKSIIKKSNPNAYLEMKTKWHVSLQALVMRAFNLKLINYQQYRYFYMLVNKLGIRENEPLDDVLPIKRPNKVKSILKLLFENNLVSVYDLKEQLKVDLDFISKLTGIPNSFFDEFELKENRKYNVNELKLKKDIKSKIN